MYRLGRLDGRVFWEELKSKFGAKREEDATKQYWALRDLSFEVKQGEVVGVLGHNGAGKSTLFKILSQITSPTSGRAMLKGRVASLLEVGPGFHMELTGKDNIYLNGAVLGMTRREITQRFDEIVAFSGIEEFINTPVKRYSVGMRVRLAFAIAAHLEPEILIADEVLAVGDAAFQQKCLGKMNDVATSGRTVLFVSHNAAAVESLCTRGIVLDKGKLVFDGTQTQAIEYYAASRASQGTDLKDRTDRTGSGEVRAVSIELRNSRGERVAVPRSGDDVEVVIKFERKGARKFPRAAVSLAITTHLGGPVFSHGNWLNGEELGDLPDSFEVRCRIPRLPLPAGHFRLGFRLQHDSRLPEAIDAFDNALDLHVEAGAFFPSGKLPTIQAGVCLVDASWRMESLAPESATALT